MKRKTVHKAPFKHFSFTDPVYQAEIHVYIGREDRVCPVFNRQWTARWKPTPSQSAKAFTISETKTGYTVYAVWLEAFDWTIRWQAIAVHELAHIAAFVLRIRGIAFGGIKNEVFAYYMEYLVKTVWQRLKNWRIPK
jgi:hypothetical protein